MGRFAIRSAELSLVVEDVAAAATEAGCVTSPAAVAFPHRRSLLVAPP